MHWFYRFTQSPVIQTTDKPVPNEDRPFTTQSEMLNHNGGSGDYGLCDPLTNTWMDWQIKNPKALVPTPFLESEHETYQLTIETLINQVKMEREGNSEMGNIAFVQNGMNYSTSYVRVGSLTGARDVETFIQNHPYALITYPVGHGHYHKVGFKNQVGQNNRCRFFDADQKDGEQIGPCEEIKKQLTASIQASIDKSRPREDITKIVFGKKP